MHVQTHTKWLWLEIIFYIIKLSEKLQCLMKMHTVHTLEPRFGCLPLALWL